jgi:hypothetical protein
MAQSMISNLILVQLNHMDTDFPFEQKFEETIDAVVCQFVAGKIENPAFNVPPVREFGKLVELLGTLLSELHEGFIPFAWGVRI